MSKISWKVLVLAIIIGVCIGVATGFIFEQPQMGIPGNKFFGFPLVWRISEMETGTETYSCFELVVDCIFWIAIVLVIALLAKLLKS